MSLSIRSTTPHLSLISLLLYASPSVAQGWGGGPGRNGGGWWNGGNNIGNDNGNNQYASAAQFMSSASFQTYERALMAHAILACLVWAFIIPVGGILLRLNLQSPWILRAHAILQTTSYIAYIAAVGLGVYLVNQFSFAEFSMWNDPHPQLGIAILVLAFFQPILGYIHHRIFKKRLAAVRSGMSGKAPGRTMPGHIHLWLGRLLIVLGIVNGGLGIRLAGELPFQTSSTTRKAAIGYGIGAGIVFLIYVLFVTTFEVRRVRAAQTPDRPRSTSMLPGGGMSGNHMPPTYHESQESLRKENTSIVLPAYQQNRMSTRYS